MSERTVAVILAAGASQRMGEAKLAMRFGGKTPLEACVDTFLACEPKFDQLIIVVSEVTRSDAEALMQRHGGVIRIVEGGTERGGSVYNALKAADCDIVALHDGARCLVSRETIQRTVAAAKEFGSGVAGVFARDTLHGPDGVIPRDNVFMAQTPQTFRYDRILEAYELAQRRGGAATDDCALYKLAGYEPYYVDGSILNQKLTGREDIPLFEAVMGGARMEMDMRTGMGEDTHRLHVGRKLILGGVHIPFEKGLLGHSDADVLTHAVMDALLGASGLNDIGHWFPDSDAQYKDISSLALLERTAGIIADAGYRPHNIDAVIVAQSPKLAPFIGDMRANIARTTGIDLAA